MLKKLLLVSIVLGLFCSSARAQSEWLYSTYFGGMGPDTPYASETDAAGNIYVAGRTNSTGSPFTDATPSETNRTYVFLLKLNGKGQLLYRKVWTDAQVFGALHVDSDGSVYLAGTAASTFVTTPGALQRTTGSPSNSGFIMKLAPDGATVFSTFFGLAIPGAINTDAAGNVILCGVAAASWVPLTPGAYLSTTPSQFTYPGFCSRLTPDGSRLLASTLFSGPDVDRDNGGGTILAASVAADAEGNFLVAGSVPTPNFPVTTGFQTEDRRRSLFQRSATSSSWSVTDDGQLGTISSIDFDRQNPQRVFVATDFGTFRSEDGGLTWHQIHDGALVLKVHPLNAAYQMRIIYGQRSLQSSTDGGLTWTDLGISTASPSGNELLASDYIAADYSTEGAFFVARNGYFHSVWFNLKTKAARQLATGYLSIGVWQTNASVLYFQQGNEWFRSLDGGFTFEKLSYWGRKVWPAPSDANVVYGFGARLENGVPAGLFRSDDRGLTWRELPSFPFQPPPGTYDPQEPVPSFYVDPDSAQTLYFFGAKRGVHRSIDGGETWQPFDEGIFNDQIQAFAKTNTGQFWAGASKSSNGFIAKISADATQLLYSSFFGGTGGASISAMSLDERGRMILTGSTASLDLVDTVQANSKPHASGFVAVVDLAANTLDVFRRLDIAPLAAKRDGQNRLQIAGSSLSRDLQVTADADQSQYGGGFSDGVWMTLDSEYNVVHSTYLGGSSGESIQDIVPLQDGRTVLVGQTDSSDFPISSDAIQPAIVPWPPYTTKEDIFVTIARYSKNTPMIPGCGMSAPEALHPGGTLPNRRPAFSWNPVTGAENYFLYLAPTADVLLSGREAETVGPLDTTAFTPNQDLTGVDYVWAVVGHNEQCGFGASSTPQYFITEGTCPLASPLNLRANMSSSGAVGLNWDAVQGASAYGVIASDSPGQTAFHKQMKAPALSDATASGGVGTEAPLAPGAYAWRVYAWNSVCGSSESSTQFFTVPDSNTR